MDNWERDIYQRMFAPTCKIPGGVIRLHEKVAAKLRNTGRNSLSVDMMALIAATAEEGLLPGDDVEVKGKPAKYYSRGKDARSIRVVFPDDEKKWREVSATEVTYG